MRYIYKAFFHTLDGKYVHDTISNNLQDYKGRKLKILEKVEDYDNLYPYFIVKYENDPFNITYKQEYIGVFIDSIYCKNN